MKIKKGFTLIELMVTVAIIAVLAAISIPIVAGLIDKSKETSDNKMAQQMTSAMEQWTAEYSLFAEDIRAGVNVNTASHERVKTSITKLGYLADINSSGINGFEKAAINKTTKYPKGETDAVIAVRVINLLKTYMKNIGDENFEPRQSDCSYWYLINSSSVLCAPNDSTQDDLFKLLGGTPPANATYWINLTDYKDNADKVSVTITQIGSGGSISGNGNNYQIGDTVHLQAEDGQQGFKGWYDQYGNLISTDKNFSFTITGSQNITAKYGDTVDITIGTKGDGGGYVEGGGSYKIGSNVTLTAHPNVNNVFVAWYVGNTKVSENATYSFTASNDTKVIAEFKMTSYNVTVEGEHGSVSGSGSYPKDKNITVSYTPDTGYMFVDWRDKTTNEVLSTSQNYSFKVTKNISLKATARKSEIKVIAETATIRDGNDFDNGSDGGSITGVGTYNYGDEIVLTATPINSDWEFAYWYNSTTDEILSNNSIYSIIAEQDLSIVAYFTYVKNMIPEGHQYIQINKEFADGSYDVYTYENAITLNTGHTMPDNPKPGDIYKTNEYTYVYKAGYWSEPNTYSEYDYQWYYDNTEGDGWLVTVFDNKNLEVFNEQILSEICNEPVTDMEYCWYYYTNVREVNTSIPESITSYNSCFYSARFLEKPFDIPDHWTSLDYLFNECTSLTEMPDIPDGVISLNGTFQYTGITQINGKIPSSVKSLQYAFAGSSITSIENGDIPDGVTSIYGAFSNCDSLEYIAGGAIPQSIETASYAFSDCDSLEYVGYMPSQLYSATYMFNNCDNLTTVKNIPDVNDGTSMLANCPNLCGITSIAISTSSSNISNILSNSCLNNGELILCPENLSSSDLLTNYYGLPYQYNCITIDNTLTGTSDDTGVMYKYYGDRKNSFTYTLVQPSVSGTYEFVSYITDGDTNDMANDTLGFLYSANANKFSNIETNQYQFGYDVNRVPIDGFITFDDDRNDRQFVVTADLEAGKTYILKSCNYYHNLHNQYLEGYSQYGEDESYRNFTLYYGITMNMLY